jgi:hypothetical protein
VKLFASAAIRYRSEHHSLSPPIHAASTKKAAELLSDGCGKLNASSNSRHIKNHFMAYLDWCAEISAKTAATETGDVAKQ